MRAYWNDVLIAESDDTIVVEGNHYFPVDSLHIEYFQDSNKTSRCFWKGIAKYKHVVVNDEVNQNACWYYPEPKAKASNIKGYFAFWKGVIVS